MPIELNHTIVDARDPQASADFLAGILGRPVEAMALLPRHPILGVDLGLGGKPIDRCVSLILAAS